MSMQSSSANLVGLPPGVSVIATRETSQQNAAGIIQQGMTFTAQLPSGTPTSVFVPYSLIGQTDAIAAAISERVRAIQAIEGLGTAG